MATPTSPQTLSDARYMVIADLGRGESVERTASFLVMGGWEEADALKFVQLMKNALDAHKKPPRPWEEEEREEDPPPDEEKEVVRILTAEERRAIEIRRALDASISNMNLGR